MRSGPVDVAVDVGAAVGSPGSDRLHMAGWAFLPPDGGRDVTTVLFCAPGRSYGKAYYHLPGHAGYSFGEYAAARGHVVVAFDYLGIGDSSAPGDIDAYTSSRLAAANHAFASHVLALLREGTLATGFDPCARLCPIGVGHSMGGFLTVRQQALHRTFDAIASLGWGLDLNLHILDDAGVEVVSTDDEAALLSIPGLRRFVEQPIDRPAFRDWFYASDVPDDVIAADDANATASLGLAGAGALVPDFSRLDVASIDVPVFIAFGERDVSANPRLEPSFYESAPDVTLLVLAGSAHCHNFASTRTVLWQRLTDWASSVAALPSASGEGEGVT